MASPYDPITHGKDFNYFERQEVTSPGFGSTADVVIPFKTTYLTLSLINEGSGTIQYSFNGNTLHGDLVPNTPSEALLFEGRQQFKIWLRVPSGSSTIRVEAFGR